MGVGIGCKTKGAPIGSYSRLHVIRYELIKATVRYLKEFDLQKLAYDSVKDAYYITPPDYDSIKGDISSHLGKEEGCLEDVNCCLSRYRSLREDCINRLNRWLTPHGVMRREYQPNYVELRKDVGETPFLDALRLFDIYGLYIFVYKSDCEGTWSCGEALDILEVFTRVKPHLDIDQHYMENVDQIMEVMDEAQSNRYSVTID